MRKLVFIGIRTNSYPIGISEDQRILKLMYILL